MISVLMTAVEEEHANELIFEPVWFGVIAFGVMLGLLAMLWSFRNTLALDPVAHGHGSEVSDAGAANPDSGRGSQR